MESTQYQEYHIRDGCPYRGTVNPKAKLRLQASTLSWNECTLRN